MFQKGQKARFIKAALMLGTASAIFATPAFAQDAGAPAAESTERVTVTGSRILRRDFTSSSPIATVTGAQTVQQADITLETYLNTLPQINPAGTTTSNNPGNGGQASIDLRGLGSNRNLVLVNGRRPMVSASDQSVDLNTIPQALIDRVEVITGGAGATYGADAIAGVVNIILKSDFEGVDARYSYSNSSEFWDSMEESWSALVGGNFADDKGNAALYIDMAERQALTKGQRSFSAVASSTTGTFPTGRLLGSLTNPIPQAAINALWATPGYGANPANSVLDGQIGFNTDGTLFGIGAPGPAQNVTNFRYGINSAAGPNTLFFPDFYSYNFDLVNNLTLPYDRTTFGGRVDFDASDKLNIFAQASYTIYDSLAAILAPSPISPVVESATGTNPNRGNSALVTAATTVNGLPVPVTNPFIPADLKTLLAARNPVADNPNLIGVGVAEPFLISWRALPLGNRREARTNTVTQYLIGANWKIAPTWELEAYASEGNTKIDQNSGGSVNVERVLELLAAADGGVALCAGGFNPFGVNPLSDACSTFISANANAKQTYKQQIVQAFARGEVADLPGGAIQLVVGGEYRFFDYDFDPSALTGAIVGFNFASADSGTNEFYDAFSELYLPVLDNLEFTLGYRYSESQFFDRLNAVEGDPQAANSYFINAIYDPLDYVKVRGGYSRTVRAPNFGELFSGGSSFPQYFDPCSLGSRQRTISPVAFGALCQATGIAALAYPTFAAPPGGQWLLETDGNTNLSPETGDTWTLGVVLQSPFEDDLIKDVSVAVDYYNITIEDVISAPDPNLFLANCFNYYGNNPGFNPLFADCSGITRVGGALSQVENPLDPSGLFPGVNQGYVETSGIDVQIDWGFDLEALGFAPTAGRFGVRTLINWVESFAVKERAGIPELEYVGTVSYFGQGLSATTPEWRINANFQYTVGDWGFLVRGRYIDEMRNRVEVQFPGEGPLTAATAGLIRGVPSIWYWDATVDYDILENVNLRLGVNNIADQQPPVYSPNVQSGTDPSVYDIVGRRVFGQVNLRF